MKPDFKKMSRSKLTAYIRENRTDDEAISLFIHRRLPQTAIYSRDLSYQELEAILKAKIESN